MYSDITLMASSLWARLQTLLQKPRDSQNSSRVSSHPCWHWQGNRQKVSSEYVWCSQLTHSQLISSNFRLPLYRDFILSLGIASVSRKSCEAILSSGPGRSIVIVIGGAAESLNARPGVTDLVLKRRLGFIRLAIKHQAPLVPVFSFGENDLYEQVDNARGSTLWKVQKKVQSLMGFTLPLFHARGIFNCKCSA